MTTVVFIVSFALGFLSALAFLCGFFGYEIADWLERRRNSG